MTSLHTRTLRNLKFSSLQRPTVEIWPACLPYSNVSELAVVSVQLECLVQESAVLTAKLLPGAFSASPWHFGLRSGRYWLRTCMYIAFPSTLSAQIQLQRALSKLIVVEDNSHMCSRGINCTSAIVASSFSFQPPMRTLS